MPKSVYIIIPCYNEGPAVRGVIESLLPLGHGIILVDDGSAEPVAPLVNGLPVYCLRHAVNLGQGAALQTGMAFARRLGAEAVVHFDADGQHDAGGIGELLAVLDEGVDVALGSRFLRREDELLVPRGKRVMLRLARLVNGVFTGMWLSDAHNGFRALGPRALAAVDLKENRMAHATEILTQIRRAGLSWREVPVRVRYTAYSREKGQKWTNSLNILIDLILNKFM